MRDSHAADAAMLSELPKAKSFVTSIFLGTGAFDRHESATLSDARNVAAQMAAHYRNGREALVYAQLPSGRQFLVPDSYNEGEATMTTDSGTTTKTFNKRFNAQRAAKSALGKDAQEGREFATSKNAAGEWTWVAIEATPKPAPKPAKAAPRKHAAKAVRKGGIFGSDPLSPPDFSANTHARFRKKLAALVALVEARDVDGIRKFHVNPVSSSPKALMRYKERALAALTA